ncbi:MAG: cyclic nucleotide-binding domain-containing protein, partial [Oligoflexia bacterium]|nr:cyclic nucleotide-binding domain-containing protein [Oligoflexia bacterium]
MTISAKPAAIKKTFAPNQFLFREGDPSNCMYVIQKGTVSIRKHKATAYVEIARLYSNEVLGELSFFDRLPRSAAAVALTEVEVLELPFESLDKIYAGIPDYLKTIISAVADRLRKANDTIRRLQKNVVKEEKDSEAREPDPKPKADTIDAVKTEEKAEATEETKAENAEAKAEAKAEAEDEADAKNDTPAKE